MDAKENVKRIQAEKDKRLESEIKSEPSPTRESTMTGEEVISEIEEFLAELKRRAQFAYPVTGSGE